MSIFNRLIIEFLKEKNKLINDKFGEEMGYIYDDDIQEIEEWIPWQCMAVLQNLGSSDLDSCPWCVLNAKVGFNENRKNCSACRYGQRHGVCNNGKNTYYKITLGCKEPLINTIPGLNELILKTSEKYCKILKNLEQMS